MFEDIDGISSEIMAHPLVLKYFSDHLLDDLCAHSYIVLVERVILAEHNLAEKWSRHRYSKMKAAVDDREQKILVGGPWLPVEPKSDASADVLEKFMPRRRWFLRGICIPKEI